MDVRLLLIYNKHTMENYLKKFQIEKLLQHIDQTTKDIKFYATIEKLHELYSFK